MCCCYTIIIYQYLDAGLQVKMAHRFYLHEALAWGSWWPTSCGPEYSGLRRWNDHSCLCGIFVQERSMARILASFWLSVSSQQGEDESVTLKSCTRRKTDSIEKRFCFDVEAVDRWAAFSRKEILLTLNFLPFPSSQNILVFYPLFPFSIPPFRRDANCSFAEISISTPVLYIWNWGPRWFSFNVRASFLGMCVRSQEGEFMFREIYLAQLYQLYEIFLLRIFMKWFKRS